MPTVGLLNMAWGGTPLRLEGGPAWLRSSFWDVIATRDPAQTVTVAQRAAMLRAMLEERFKLVLRRQARPTDVYALVLAQSDGTLGPSMQRAESPCDAPGRLKFSITPPPPRQRPACGLLRSLSANAILGGNVPIELLTRSLAGLVGRPIVDRTGLTGEFDIVLVFQQDARDLQLPPSVLSEPPTPAALPDIFTAVQEQLGLKLESTRAPIDYYVVERIEMPSPN